MIGCWVCSRAGLNAVEERNLILTRNQNMIPWSSSLKPSNKILLLKCNLTARLMELRLEGKKCKEAESLISTVLITLSGECVNDSSYLRVMQRLPANTSCNHSVAMLPSCLKSLHLKMGHSWFLSDTPQVIIHTIILLFETT